MTDAATPRALDHHPWCFCCGTENPASLGFVPRLEGDRVRAEVVLDKRFQGAGGLVHGGVLTALLDELMGAVPGGVGRYRVTASIEVRFKAPVAVGERVVAEAWIERSDEKGFDVAATIRYPGEDRVRVRATGRFVYVDRAAAKARSRAG